MANNRIILKRTTTSGRLPNTTGSYATNTQYIGAGELALNMADGILFSSNGSTLIEVGANNRTHNISTNSLTVGTTLYVVSNGNVGIGNTSPNAKLTVTGTANVSGNVVIGGTGIVTGNVAIGTTNTTAYALNVNGSFAATTKSFVINHPTKKGSKLRYGSLEGPENGVYARGKLVNEAVIELPDYWTGLVDEETITVNLTPIGSSQNLYVQEVANNKVFVCSSSKTKPINCYYTVYAERKDVEKLVVEI